MTWISSPLKNSESESPTLSSFPSFLRIAIVVVSLWTLSAVALYFALPNWETRGAFGDTFGAVNALFSGLAFGGILVALFVGDGLGAGAGELRRD